MIASVCTREVFFLFRYKINAIMLGATFIYKVGFLFFYHTFIIRTLKKIYKGEYLNMIFFI